MKGEVEISVVIPVYNTGRYLDECLWSVQRQEFGDWECVMVDDGSTDGSGAVCERWAARDERFRAYHTANRGVSAARNEGMSHARGTYLAFVDSDDTIEPGYLSTLHRAMTGSGAELAICGLRRVGPDRTAIVEPDGGVFTLGGEEADRFVDLNRKFLLYGPVVKLYRRDIITDNAIRFPLGIHYGEDLIFNFDYLEHAHTIAAVRAHGYNYRIGPAGTTLSTSRLSRDHAANYRQWQLIRRFFDRHGITGLAATEFLSNRLWGLAYEAAMNNRLSPGQLSATFNTSFMNDLKTFDTPSIELPPWLRKAVIHRNLPLLWLIQRRPRR